MAHFTRVSFIFFIRVIVVNGSEESREAKAKPGEIITLGCVVPGQAPIEVIKWIRPDLDSDHYVFFYRDGSALSSYQHPIYVDRVELRDPDMKGGDVSVMLNNVNINDTGIYDCEVSVSTGRRKRAQSQLFCTIELKVEDSGRGDPWYGPVARFLQLEEHPLLYVIIAAVVVLLSLVGIIAVVIKMLTCPKHTSGNEMDSQNPL